MKYKELTLEIKHYAGDLDITAHHPGTTKKMGCLVSTLEGIEREALGLDPLNLRQVLEDPRYSKFINQQDAK